MPTTFIEPLPHVGQRVAYTEGEDAARPVGERCDFATSADFVAYCEEMRRDNNRRIEAYGLRVSWGDELDPDSPEDIKAALDYTYELCARIAPDSPCHLVAHNDGRGGKLHVHAEIANHDPVTGRALRSNRSARIVRALADDVARCRGMQVIGDTREKRERWAKRHGLQIETVEPAGPAGWQGKRGMPEVSDFERKLGDAVAEALDGASNVEDFKSRLAKSGVTVSVVPKKERDPETGEKVTVTDPETGDPVPACWRYSMEDAGGRTRRRKDSNLSPEFTRQNVTEVLERRQAALDALNRSREDARARAARDAAAKAREEAERRAAAIEAMREAMRPRVSPAQVFADLDALIEVRRKQLAQASPACSGEPVMTAIEAASASDAARMEHVEALQFAADRVHRSRKIEPGESAERAQASVFDAVAKTARDAAVALLAMMQRIRLVLFAAQLRGEKVRAHDAQDVATLAIADYDEQHGTGVQEEQGRQLQFTYTMSRTKSRQLSL